MEPPISTPRRPISNQDSKLAKTKSDSAITNKSPTTFASVELTDITYGPQPRFFHPTNKSLSGQRTRSYGNHRKSSLIDFSDDLAVTFGPSTPRFFTATPSDENKVKPSVALALIRFEDDTDGVDTSSQAICTPTTSEEVDGAQAKLSNEGDGQRFFGSPGSKIFDPISLTVEAKRKLEDSPEHVNDETSLFGFSNPNFCATPRLNPKVEISGENFREDSAFFINNSLNTMSKPENENPALLQEVSLFRPRASVTKAVGSESNTEQGSESFLSSSRKFFDSKARHVEEQNKSGPTTKNSHSKQCLLDELPIEFITPPSTGDRMNAAVEEASNCSQEDASFSTIILSSQEKNDTNETMYHPLGDRNLLERCSSKLFDLLFDAPIKQASDDSKSLEEGRSSSSPKLFTSLLKNIANDSPGGSHPLQCYEDTTSLMPSCSSARTPVNRTESEGLPRFTDGGSASLVPRISTSLCNIETVQHTRSRMFGSTLTVNDSSAEENKESLRRVTSIFNFFKPRWIIGSTMKCSCMGSAGSYERLPHVSTFLELSSIYNRDSEDKDSSTEKQEELVFFNDDNSFQSVVVEKDLCVSDLCQLLALKNRVAKDVNWTIVEHWVDLGLERSLEDHEDVLAAYQSMNAFSKKASKKLVFRKDFIKYEFFHNPQQFFPTSMIDWGDTEGIPNIADRFSSLQAILTSGEECPMVFSHVWIQDSNKQLWSKAYLVLKDRKLYLSSKVHVIMKLMRRGTSASTSSAESSPSNSLSSSPNNGTSHDGEAEIFAELSNYQIYTTLNAKNHLRAPTEFGICLRPLVTLSDSNEPSLSALKCLACESDRVRLCWITAMRLAKYGKQLRENYRSFRNKHLENMSPKQYNNFILPSESVRSRVAMDFTGNVGRIVDDPKEAKAIALAEGYTWKRRWRPVMRQPSGKLVSVQGTQSSVHVTQPWFHSGMTRDMAAALIAKHGSVDGVFLVRDCHSNPGAYVLTLKTGNKVVHKEILPISEVGQEALFYSLDGGQTKFYDLLQLVEFYQLNAGSLPSKLTYYLVQGAGGVLYREKTNRTVPSC